MVGICLAQAGPNVQQGASWSIAELRRMEPAEGIGRTMDHPTKSLTTAEAAAFLGLEPETLEAWRRRGGGPPYVKYGDSPRAAVRYRLRDLEAYQAEHIRENTAEAP